MLTVPAAARPRPKWPIISPFHFVTLSGQDANHWLFGIVAQADGRAAGRARLDAALVAFDAQRSEAHADDAHPCVLCHPGDNPVWPQPPDHPPYRVDPPNCLTCHEVVITG